MRRLAALLVAAVALLAACSEPIHGTGSAKSAASATTADPTTTSAAVPTPTASPVLTAAHLLGLVIPVPAGATASTDPWAANSTPTIAQFADVQYAPADAADGAAALESAGVQVIAHRSWYVAKGASADDILLAFAGPDHAKSWLSETAASTAGASGYTPVAAVDGMSGYTFATPNSDGDVVTVFYGVVGAVGVIVDYWTPQRYDPAAAQEWLPAQLARLR